MTAGTKQTGSGGRVSRAVAVPIPLLWGNETGWVFQVRGQAVCSISVTGEHPPPPLTSLRVQPLGQHSFSLPLPLPPVVPGTPLQECLLGRGSWLRVAGFEVRGGGLPGAEGKTAGCDC